VGIIDKCPFCEYLCKEKKKYLARLGDLKANISEIFETIL